VGDAVMFYVQHLMGIGHQRRMAAIARACSALGLRVVYVSGGMPLTYLELGDARLIQLAPCRCPDLKFDRLVDAEGREVDDHWRARRAAHLLDVWHREDFRAVLVETFPFGRKLMRFELLPLLKAATADGVLRLSSIRDIIEYRPKRAKYNAMADHALRYFDKVLVHADPTLVPLQESFPMFSAIAHMVRYTGYVREFDDVDEESPGDDGRDEVVVSAGGGAYGEQVLRNAIEARPFSALRDHRWRILVGENLSPEHLRALRTRATAGVVVERTRADFRGLLRRAAVSISQGGYNTVMDILSTGVRAVLVAYHDATEREQLLRGRVLAERGLVELLAEGDLNPVNLARAVDAAYLLRPAPLELQMDGAERSAQIIVAGLTARAG